MHDRKELIVIDGNNNNNNNGGGGDSPLSGASSPPPSPHPLHPAAVPHTLRELFILFAVSFSYALVFATTSNILIPKEITALAETSQSTWVGVIVGSGALAQIATPIVGALSDRAGVREPYLKAGTGLIVVGVGVLFLATQMKLLIALFFSYLLLSVGLSTVYAIATTLLSDFVAEEQMAVGSAVMGTNGLLGAGVGYSLFAVGLNGDALVCATYTVVTLLGFFITHYAMSILSAANRDPVNTLSHGSSGAGGGGTSIMAEASSTNDGEDVDGKQSKPPQPGASAVGTHLRNYLGVVVHALTFPSPSTHPDFSLACASRGFFNAGLALQNFMLFFFRDVAARRSGNIVDAPDRMVARLAVLALLGGLISAVPAGMLADRFGPKVVISIASLVCICSILAFPLLAGTGANALFYFDAVGFLLGIGQCCFIICDYNLGVRSLPKMGGKPTDAAKDLGVFALSATAGALVGQFCFAGVLERFSTHVPVSVGTSGGSGPIIVRYDAHGFNVSFVIAAVFFFISAICACLIKSLK